MPSLKDFGLQFEPQGGMSAQELVDWCRYAERKGYGYAFRSDHLLPIPDGTADSGECWASLGAIAVSTKTLKFGPMVTPVSYRNPALLAKMARTVNILSKGRLIFGLGAGWYKREYLAYGYEFPEFSTRLDQFEEALKIIVPMTTGEKVHFKGKYFSADVEALPKTKTFFLIGGRHPRVIKATARYADEWNIYASPAETFLESKALLDSAISGKKVVISQTGPVKIAENRRGAIQVVKKSMRKAGKTGDPEAEIEKQRKRGILVGTPAEVAAQINERRELGVQRFYLEVINLETPEMADILTETLKGL